MATISDSKNAAEQELLAGGRAESFDRLGEYVNELQNKEQHGRSK